MRFGLLWGADTGCWLGVDWLMRETECFSTDKTFVEGVIERLNRSTNEYPIRDREEQKRLLKRGRP